MATAPGCHANSSSVSNVQQFVATMRVDTPSQYLQCVKLAVDLCLLVKLDRVGTCCRDLAI